MLPYIPYMDPMGNMNGGYFPWTPAVDASGASGTSPRLGQRADLQGVDRWESGWFCIEMMDWFKGKSTGNHRFSHEIWGFPVNFPLNQSIDRNDGRYWKSQWSFVALEIWEDVPAGADLQWRLRLETGSAECPLRSCQHLVLVKLDDFIYPLVI